MFDKNINHGKLFVGITKIKGKLMTSETFLLSNTSFLSYPMNNFLKENKLPWQGRDKSIHEEANTVNFLKTTTSHKRPLCK